MPRSLALWIAFTTAGSTFAHCRVLTHAEGPDGMFGMVTALNVQE